MTRNLTVNEYFRAVVVCFFRATAAIFYIFFAKTLIFHVICSIILSRIDKNPSSWRFLILYKVISFVVVMNKNLHSECHFWHSLFYSSIFFLIILKYYKHSFRLYNIYSISPRCMDINSLWQSNYNIYRLYSGEVSD